MISDIEMEDPAATVLDDKETVQDSKGDCWNSEKVHSSYGFTMIAQESSPKLSGLIGWRYAANIARNSPFRDIESELQ